MCAFYSVLLCAESGLLRAAFHTGPLGRALIHNSCPHLLPTYKALNIWKGQKQMFSCPCFLIESRRDNAKRVAENDRVRKIKIEHSQHVPCGRINIVDAEWDIIDWDLCLLSLLCLYMMPFASTKCSIRACLLTDQQLCKHFVSSKSFNQCLHATT